MVCTSLLAAGLFGCDHATKAAATSSLAAGGSVPLLGDWVALRYVRNDDVAFNLVRALGIGPEASPPIVLAALAGLALVVLAVGWTRLRRAPGMSPRLVDVGFAIAFAGALGNLVDRVARGYVVDFIMVKRWPVFNVADVLVVVGLFVVVLARRRRATLEM